MKKVALGLVSLMLLGTAAFAEEDIDSIITEKKLNENKDEGSSSTGNSVSEV